MGIGAAESGRLGLSIGTEGASVQDRQARRAAGLGLWTGARGWGRDFVYQWRTKHPRFSRLFRLSTYVFSVSYGFYWSQQHKAGSAGCR